MDDAVEITEILDALHRGDEGAADRLVALVYHDLKQMAVHLMAGEPAGVTIGATGLVHEAYLRLFHSQQSAKLQNRQHFFAAAAQAMRRILIDQARRRQRMKRGGAHKRVDLEDLADISAVPDRILAIDESLQQLQQEDPQSAEVATLRLYAGLSIETIADVIGISRATAYRDWAYARSWLQESLQSE